MNSGRKQVHAAKIAQFGGSKHVHILNKNTAIKNKNEAERGFKGGGCSSYDMDYDFFVVFCGFLQQLVVFVAPSALREPSFGRRGENVT